VIKWLTPRRAPEKIIATHYVNNNAANGVQFDRPACAYPEVSRLIAHGDPLHAGSFKCVRDLPQ